MQLLKLVWWNHRCSHFGARHDLMIVSAMVVSLNGRVGIYHGRLSLLFVSVEDKQNLRQLETP